ncbi:EamA family transporter [Desulfosarcina ovata]|uniref:EamA domain-containing protein n=1 Tax=Desulfosarcina ovata subsp. ovata TaxID=2752305 RepID=A0A5K8ABX6_9BACT|nr:EamA family transporter [Desulfosarcina ovata]BBO90223.1 hypothetical protein DSCOOX_34030 [Desulfosarcina ovata subsp. ovata]
MSPTVDRNSGRLPLRSGIHRYTVSRLAAFTFMAPLFGVILGGLVLNEPLTVSVWTGLACVAGGLYMINR